MRDMDVNESVDDSMEAFSGEEHVTDCLLLWIGFVLHLLLIKILHVEPSIR
jgi:hypothetical protein